MVEPEPQLESALTDFQIDVARLFFELPASRTFVLAGGAALAAQRLITRPTRDLDLFTGSDHGDVTAARDAFEAAARDRGWAIKRMRDSASFCRLVVSGPEDLIVDLALDSPPNLPPVASIAGPTFALEELAGRKLVALFDRAEARDFVDVYLLAHRFAKQTLLDQASEIDHGFDQAVLAEMARMHTRFPDHDFPTDVQNVQDIRTFFDEWANELLR